MRRTSLITLVLCTSPQPARALDVTLTAFAETGEHRFGYGGMLVVSVPWSRWFGDPAPSALVLPDDPGLAAQLGEDPLGEDSTTTLYLTEDATLAELAQDEEPLPLDPAAEPTAPSPVPEDPSNGEPSGPRDDASDTVVAGQEPTVVELTPTFVGALVDQSLTEFDRLTSRLDSLASRSKTSAWLPNMSLRAGRNIDQTLRLTPTDSDPDRWQLTGGADLRLEAQLKWEFDRLLYASDELSIERIRLAAVQRRAQLVDKVLDWLFRWQIAQLHAGDPLVEPLERAAAVLRVQQAARALDVLSGGWFSPHVERVRRSQAAKQHDSVEKRPAQPPAEGD